MAIKISFLVTFIILLGNTHGYALESLESEPRGVLSENLAVQLNNLINETLSRQNIQTLLNNALPDLENLRTKLLNEDLLEIFLKRYVEHPISRLQKRSVEDVESIIFVLNSEIGGTVLVIANDTIVIDVDALGEVVLNYATAYIKQQYPDDSIAQLILIATVKLQIELRSAQIKPILSQLAIPVEAIDQAISLAIGSNRSKRDITDVLLDLIRGQLSNVLSPVLEEINGVLDDIVATILSLYSSEQPSNTVVSLVTNITNIVVVRLAEVVVTVQYNVNLLLSNIINGTTTSDASRRRRDVDLDLDLNYDEFSRVDLQLSHRRVTRSTDLIWQVLRSLISTFTGPLNTWVKDIFVSFLAAQYENIGKLVTTPLRILVEVLVDLILPCSDCASIIF